MKSAAAEPNLTNFHIMIDIVQAINVPTLSGQQQYEMCPFQISLQTGNSRLSTNSNCWYKSVQL